MEIRKKPIVAITSSLLAVAVIGTGIASCSSNSDQARNEESTKPATSSKPSASPSTKAKDTKKSPAPAPSIKAPAGTQTVTGPKARHNTGAVSNNRWVPYHNTGAPAPARPPALTEAQKLAIALANQRAQLVSARDNAAAALNTINSNITKANADRDAAKIKLNNAIADQKRFEDAVETATKDLDQANADLSAKQAVLDQANAIFDAAKSDYDTKLADFKEANRPVFAALDEAKAKVAEAKTALKEATNAFNKANAEYVAKVADATKRRDEANAAIQKANADKAAASSALDAASKQVNTLKPQITNLQSQIDSLEIVKTETPFDASKLTPQQRNDVIGAMVAYQVNQYREMYGLKPLAVSIAYSENAEEWSHKMAGSAGYNHASDFGLDALSGVSVQGYSENIHKGYGSGNSINDLEKFANYLVNGWIKSPGHRTNLLSDSNNLMAVGVNYNPNGVSFGTWRAFNIADPSYNPEYHLTKYKEDRWMPTDYTKVYDGTKGNTQTLKELSTKYAAPNNDPAFAVTLPTLVGHTGVKPDKSDLGFITYGPDQAKFKALSSQKAAAEADLAKAEKTVVESQATIDNADKTIEKATSDKTTAETDLAKLEATKPVDENVNAAKQALDEATATETKAQADVDALADKAPSRTALDDAAAKQASAQADVTAAKATVDTANSAVNTAKANVSKAVIEQSEAKDAIVAADKTEADNQAKVGPATDKLNQAQENLDNFDAANPGVK